MNTPAKNATILVDGVAKAKTDKTGRYTVTFDKIPGTYKVEPEHLEYYFEPVTMTIDESTKELPTITATTVYICGNVYVIEGDKLVRDFKPREIYIEHMPNPL